MSLEGLIMVESMSASFLNAEPFYPSYRFIWNTVDKICSVTCSRDGYEGIVNGAAGKILADISDLGVEAIEKANSSASKFIESAINMGWINEAGLNGTLTKIDHHLPLKRIQIELTTRCNLRCSYCYSESGPTCVSALKYEEVRQILSDASDLGCIWVDFTGGEFFLYKYWVQVLAYARNLGLIVSIHTNGMALNEENLTMLSSFNIRTVQVSLDSHLPHIHDSIRGVDGALEKTINGIKRAKKAGLRIKVCVMVHGLNKNHIADTVDWITSTLQVPVMLDRIIKAGGELKVGVGISTKDYYELIAPIVGPRVFSSKICDSLSKSQNSHRVEPICGVAHDFVYVTADGEFALCPTMTSRDNQSFEGPRQSSVSLKEAWLHSAYFNNYRHLNCKNTKICPAAAKCGGGCRSNAYLESSELDAPDFLACNMNKNPTNKYVDFKAIYDSGKFLAS